MSCLDIRRFLTVYSSTVLCYILYLLSTSYIGGAMPPAIEAEPEGEDTGKHATNCAMCMESMLSLSV